MDDNRCDGDTAGGQGAAAGGCVEPLSGEDTPTVDGACAPHLQFDSVDVRHVSE